MRWGRRLAPLLISVALVVATGTLGFVLSESASSRSASLHRSDRDNLQATLASLGKQYILFSLKEGADYASTGTWALRTGDPSDHARLQSFVDHAVLLNYGVALLGLSGEELNQYTAGPGLPPMSDPGYRPMVSALVAGQPDVSSVMKINGIPVVAMGVPVSVAGQTKAVFVGFVRLDHSALETYVQSIHYGKTGVTYVVDSTGTVVAASNPRLIGNPIGQPRAVSAVSRAKAGNYQSNGDLVSYAPFGIGGWSGMITQKSSEFFGAIRSGELRVELAIVALLAVASVVITILGYKRESARRRFQEQLAFQAYHDHLTGLANRVTLIERLREALGRSERMNTAVAVLYLDLDGFKHVNDTLGHDAGDAALVAISARLTEIMRAKDVVARMGGDEFAILIEDLSTHLAWSNVEVLAQRIVTEVSRPITVNGHEAAVGVSVGIAICLDGRDDVETMLRDADLAMYSAKDHPVVRYAAAGRSGNSPASLHNQPAS